MDLTEKTIICSDDNIDDLRRRYPEGLRFVVGDTHGEAATLKALMDKIKFDPGKDHVFFVGDYNGGGYVWPLLEYMAAYYQPDCSRPGFHMIRGNHERELWPEYTLDNLPDLIVIREKYLTYYIVHAGMTRPAFELINADMAKDPDRKLFAYRLDPECVGYDAPLRQLIWSRNGLYSQRSHWGNWPSEEALLQSRACIIHGHSPYCFFKHENYYSYGERKLFWQNQHIFFSESLQSFNIDANVKGRYANGEGHRRLSCVCLESIEEIAAQSGGRLTRQGVKDAPNFVFSARHRGYPYIGKTGDIKTLTTAAPEAKRITLDENRYPVIWE